MDADDGARGSFLVLQPRDMGAVLETPDQPRKKRVHRKSRLGCIACKKRRVKCDEQIPCLHCVKRKEQCLRSASPSAIATTTATSATTTTAVEEAFRPRFSVRHSLSIPTAHFAGITGDAGSPINLMHLELLHHFEHVTMSTLSLPEVWPTVLRQAFDEEFIMSTILCVAAAHLAVLSPQEPKYSSAKSQLLPKSLRLLRLGLSRPITKQTCDALAGTTVLVNYISWCNLDFLAEQHISHHPGGSDTTTGLDLSQDQLFLLSPGVLQVYLQGLPVFIEHDSVFLTIGKQHPRINIENVLAARGEDATRFVEPFMKMWDDPRYMTCSAPAGDQASSDTPFRRTWSFFSEVESELYRTYDTSSRPKDVMLVYYGNTPEETRDAILRVQSAKNSNAAGDIPTPESQPGEVALGEQALIPRRTAFERVVRRLSPLLSCLSAPQGSANAFPGAPMPRQADLQRLIFTFPVFCCGAMLELVAAGDARTLIMLYHFYRAVRILLPTEESWWAGERSRHLEGLILAELKARGYDACLR